MSRKFTDLINKEKRGYKEFKLVRKILKDGENEDITIYNPTMERRDIYFKEFMESNEKSNGDVQLSSMYVFIAGMKAFTDIEMDAESIEEYLQIITYIEEDCSVYEELRNEILKIVKEVNEGLEELVKTLESKEEKPLESLSKEELIEMLNKKVGE